MCADAEPSTWRKRATVAIASPSPARSALPADHDNGPKILHAPCTVDVVGFSGPDGSDESGTPAALKGLRREVVDPPIAAHRAPFATENVGVVSTYHFAYDDRGGKGAPTGGAWRTMLDLGEEGL